MKSEDFDRLKAVCEKEGFEILNLTHNDNEKYVIVKKKKDEWEGVEFACNPKRAFKIEKINSNAIYYNDVLGLAWSGKNRCLPLTESEYVTQLKAEAFKRFGEIKEGDRFDRDWGLIGKMPYGVGIIGDFKEDGFDYRKCNDALMFRGTTIYIQGKWATKVKERVKVEWASTSCDTIRFNYGNSKDVNLVKDGPILAKLIEDYLNR